MPRLQALFNKASKVKRDGAMAQCISDPLAEITGTPDLEDLFKTTPDTVAGSSKADTALKPIEHERIISFRSHAFDIQGDTSMILHIVFGLGTFTLVGAFYLLYRRKPSTTRV